MRPYDPAGVYSPAAVIAALTAQQGARTMRYRYDRLDAANNYLGPLDGMLAGSVANNFLADIKRTAKFTILDLGQLNYLTDRIKPWARLSMPDGGTVEWPLGVFLLSTPSRPLDDTNTVKRSVTAYDQLQVLSDDKVTDRYAVAAGVAYTDAIVTIVTGTAGLGAYSVIPSALTLPVALEWDAGTSKLKIINDLLAAINYDSAVFDEQGVLICQPYVSPSSRTSQYTYANDTASVILAGTPEQTLDLFAVPNSWVLVKSEADQSLLRSVYTNTNPLSPTSTVSRGRTIVSFATEQDAADQTTLDAKAARLAFEASQVYEGVKFSTAAMPIHQNSDVYTLNLSALGLAAKYSETAWELPLAVGAKMTHTVRRVVSV
jgi:hypothetical protein